MESCLTYKEVAEILKLAPEDETINKLTFDAAFSELEKVIGYNLNQTDVDEYQLVIEDKICIDAISLNQLIGIYDEYQNDYSPKCRIDVRNKIIYFPDDSYNNKYMRINYNTGFSRETLPVDLKECLIKLFLIKRNSILTLLNTNQIPPDANFEEIERVVNLYKKKAY